jgi:hypothetical protein
VLVLVVVLRVLHPDVDGGDSNACDIPSNDSW